MAEGTSGNPIKAWNREVETKVQELDPKDRSLYLHSLPDLDFIENGTEILIYTVFGWTKAEVGSLRIGKEWAENDSVLFPLKFSVERGRWENFVGIDKSILPIIQKGSFSTTNVPDFFYPEYGSSTKDDDSDNKPN